MKIYIELLIPLLIALLFIIWGMWLFITKKISQRRYNENKDRGKIGEEHRQELIGAGFTDPSGRIAKTIIDSSRQDESERRNDVSSTDVGDAGKDSSRIRERSSRRGIFKRLRRR